VSRAVVVRLLAMAVVGVWLFAGCMSSDGGDTLDEDDNGSTQQVDAGDTLVVELEGNPTTGYTWYVASIDEAVLRQVGEADFDPDSDAEGASGTVTLRFEAMNPGTSPLELVYRRGDESNDAATERWQITVEVEE
jgi:inhibitor of cysteine peptidase